MWSQNLVALIQWFAPANVVMTFDPNCGDLDSIITRDANTGDISKLIFPERIIVTANHQVGHRKASQNEVYLLNISIDLCRLDLYLVHCSFSRCSWRNQDYLEA